MDEEIYRWILEFLVRQQVDDKILDCLLSALPLQDEDLQLKKALLLRRIRSESENGEVSEKILDLLELVGELDLRERKVASETMKAAYSAVAVDCTVVFLEGELEVDGKYLETLERIWRRRVQKMLNSENPVLVSDKLLNWRVDLEAAIEDVELRSRILSRNTRNEALKAIKGYLKEAWSNMGPSFLEKIAENVARMGKVGQGMEDIPISKIAEHTAIPLRSMLADSGPGVGGNSCGETTGGFNCVGNTGVHHDGMVSGGGYAVDEDTRVEVSGNEDDKSAAEPDRRDELVSEAFGDGRRVDTDGTRNGHVLHGRVMRMRITNIEELDGDTSTNKYHYVPSPVVVKLREALKSSFADLQAVVRDPLPEALKIAENVMSEMHRNSAVAGNCDDQNNVSASNDITEQTSLGANGEDQMQHFGARPEREDCGNHNQLSLMVLNPCSTNGSIGDSEVSLDRPYLRSPSRRKISPLKKYEYTKIVRRRQRKKWSVLEEDALRKGVEQFGRGSWKIILNTYCNVFEERTEVDLKDKWRNMTRNIR